MNNNRLVLRILFWVLLFGLLAPEPLSEICFDITLVLWALFILVVFIGLLTSVSVTEDEVLDALSLTVWKTVTEIKDELRHAKGVNESWRAVAGVHRHLQTLEAGGYVERNIRAIALDRGSIYIQLEFRRTGKRRGSRVRRKFFWLPEPAYPM